MGGSGPRGILFATCVDGVGVVVCEDVAAECGDGSVVGELRWNVTCSPVELRSISSSSPSSSCAPSSQSACWFVRVWLSSCNSVLVVSCVLVDLLMFVLNCMLCFPFFVCA